MDFSLQDVKEAQETFSIAEVNRMLSEGWVLVYISHEPSRSRYVLVKFE
ncbi:hypothetical protein KB559_10750 [Paenibacillus sp. Marseille-P2973]|nr:hypothetical protein [Paenibacillus sp. Marseille-P2973]MBQ4899315.1 hypothetical protein [Paenibacillus sp. Marseille-P2973]